MTRNDFEWRRKADEDISSRYTRITLSQERCNVTNMTARSTHTLFA
jgi:hypothetical protein